MLDAAALQVPATAALCWQLPRPCALTPRQFLASYAVLLASLQGWWIVVGYCALEMLGAGVLYWPYMVHALDGACTTLAPGGRLTIDLARGLRQRHGVMNPAWTRLERELRQALAAWQGQRRIR